MRHDNPHIRLNPAAALVAAFVFAPSLAQAVSPPEVTRPADGAGRADENAVRQAADAFGTSVGRETIGLYSAGSVRGFSPVAAGNARIEGMYFDQVWAPSSRIRRASNIRVGISGLGYPFPAPTGIVDYSFRKPGDTRKLAVQTGGDSNGGAFIEADAELPLAERELSLGLGTAITNTEYPNGTNARYRNVAVTARWTPSADVELVPFWHRSEGYDDEKGPTYQTRDGVLPPRIERRRFHGPHWADYRGSSTNYGALATWRVDAGWTLRAGAFRSMQEDRRNFSHLLTDVRPDGRAKRVLIVDPAGKNASTSGELRATRELVEGERLHTVHLSVRARDRERRYDGSQRLDFGPTTIDTPFLAGEPEYAFGEQTRDRTRQWTGGLAYEGRWRGVGELGMSIQKTDYRKQLMKPGKPVARAKDGPWLYNVAAAAHISPAFALFAGLTRGLEESGSAPENALNRNELLPAIRTSQVDVGMRYALTPDLKLVAAVFDVRKPYFNFDAAKRFTLLGDLRNRGIEMSLAGRLTPRLDLVAGAVLARPQATGEGVRLGRVGKLPVGLPERSAEVNLDWRTPWIEQLSLGMTASHSGKLTATVDNRVSIPERTLVGLNGRYRFLLNDQPATLRVALSNVFDTYGVELRGAGAYDIVPGRVASAYLSIDM